VSEQTSRPTLSFIIPALNEEESIEILAGEIRTVMAEIDQPFEIIWVDDGSTDGTAAAMARTREGEGEVSILSMCRNRGKSEAYSRAFQHATGALLVTLDADLQDNPAESPRLFEILDQGYDLVIGRKLGRMGNEPRKALASRPFNFALRLLFGLNLHDTNSGFRVMRLPVARALSLYGDLYRFIPQLSHLNGFRVTELGVVHRKRKFGHSKYGVIRFWTGLLDLFTLIFISIFLNKPLHFFATLGLASAVIGVLLELYVLTYKVMGSPFQQHVAAITIGVMMIILGVQFFMSGVLADMLAEQRRILQELRDRSRDQVQ